METGCELCSLMSKSDNLLYLFFLQIVVRVDGWHTKQSILTPETSYYPDYSTRSRSGYQLVYSFEVLLLWLRVLIVCPPHSKWKYATFVLKSPNVKSKHESEPAIVFPHQDI